MKSPGPLTHKLNSRGFSHHFILPVLAILAVVGIGAWTLHATHAATASYYSATCATKNTYRSGANGGSCVRGIQELLDGLQHAKYKVGGKLYVTTTTVIQNQTFAYGRTGGDYLIFNGIYNTATQSAITKLTGDKTVSALDAGTSANADWQILCTDIAKSGIQKTTNANSAPLDFKNGNTTGTITLAAVFTSICGPVKNLPTSGSGGSTSGSGGSGGSGGSSGSSNSPSGNPGRFGMALGGGWEGYSSSQLNTYFTGMQSIGTQWVRFDVQWSTVQSSSSSYNWAPYDNMVKAARAHNLKVLGILDAAPRWAQQSSCAGQYSCPPNGTSAFATFAAAAAAHYAPMGVTAWEIYNEQNTGTFWSNPSASAYTALLKAAYTAVHKAVPSGETVVSGGLAPSGGGGYVLPNTYVKQMYAAGAKGYFDALGDHPYCFSDPVTYCATNNSGSTDGWGMMAYGPNNIESIMKANGDSSKRIWMTEFGADSNYTPAQVSQMMQQAFNLTNGQSWAGPIFWYSYLNGDGFGLLGSNGSPTPAYNTYKQLTGK